MKLKYLINITILLSLLFSDVRHRCPEYNAHNVRDDRPELEMYYESPSGHFWIHYDSATDDAPDLTDIDFNGIPDYVEQVALAADSARYVLTEQMGFINENYDDDQKYDIYILGLSPSLWGQTQYESSGSSFIKIRNSYEGMSNFCDNSNDLMWLTVGHEFFHAIQYSYRTNSNDSYFRELSSMWFENIFVPDCYDFLEFVDMSSNSLFNSPENAFAYTTTGSYGYSLSLFGHYLSTIIDPEGEESQLNSNVIREVWENYSENLSSTIFKSLKDVLEDNYDTSFSYAWSDFMTRNMFCGELENMSNDIYYHPGQSLIEPPDFSYESTLNVQQNTYNLNIYSDRVSFLGFNALENMSFYSTFSQTNNYLWYGLLSDDYIFNNLSGNDDFTNNDIAEQSKFFFILMGDDNSNIDIEVSIDIEGCTDFYANNYSEFATIDDGSCIYRDRLTNPYPNPVNLENQSISFDYIASNETELSFSIVDLQGREISKKTFKNLSIGRNNIIISDLGYLASGVYFILINDLESLKFINIK